MAVAAPGAEAVQEAEAATEVGAAMEAVEEGPAEAEATEATAEVAEVIIVTLLDGVAGVAREMALEEVTPAVGPVHEGDTEGLGVAEEVMEMVEVKPSGKTSLFLVPSFKRLANLAQR